jgi:hypothetical protein
VVVQRKKLMMKTLKTNSLVVGLAAMTVTVSSINCAKDPTAEPDDPSQSRASRQAAVLGPDGGTDAPRSNPPSLPAPSVYRPSVSLYDTPKFDVPDSSWVTIPYLSKLYDDSSIYNSSTGKFLFRGATSVHVCASLASFSKDFELDVFLNDARERAIAVSSQGIAQGCRTVDVQPGTVLDVRVYQQNGATLSFAGNAYWNWLTLDRVVQVATLLNNGTFNLAEYAFTPLVYTQTSSLGSWYSGNTLTALINADIHVCASLASFSNDFEIDLWGNGQREKSFAMAQRGIATGCRAVRMLKGNTMQMDLYQSTMQTMSFLPNAYWSWAEYDTIPGRSAAQDITPFTAPSNTWWVVPYTSTYYNDRGELASSGRFTAADAGDYHFCVSLTDFGQRFEVDLAINSGREKAVAISRNGAAQGCRTVRLAKSDYVEAIVHQETNADMSFSPNAYWNWMTVSKIAP